MGERRRIFSCLCSYHRRFGNPLVPFTIGALPLPSLEDPFLNWLQPSVSEFSGPSPRCSRGSALLTKDEPGVGTGGRGAAKQHGISLIKLKAKLMRKANVIASSQSH